MTVPGRLFLLQQPSSVIKRTSAHPIRTTRGAAVVLRMRILCASCEPHLIVKCTNDCCRCCLLPPPHWDHITHVIYRHINKSIALFHIPFQPILLSVVSVSRHKYMNTHQRYTLEVQNRNVRDTTA